MNRTEVFIEIAAWAAALAIIFGTLWGLAKLVMRYA